MDVASLKVGDMVGINPSNGHDYTATVTKVNKNGIVVKGRGGREIRFSLRGRMHGECDSWRPTLLCSVEQGKRGELANACESAWKKIEELARRCAYTSKPITPDTLKVLRELVDSIPQEEIGGGS